MTQVQLTVVVWNEGGVFVSKCPEIEVSSAGDTEEAAIENLKEAIELWLVNARNLGIIDEYLPIMKADNKSTLIIELSV